MRGGPVIPGARPRTTPLTATALAGSALLGAAVSVVACSSEHPPPPPHVSTSSPSSVGAGGDPSGAGGSIGIGGSGGAPPAGCGDGIIVFPEQCEGKDLGGATCKDVGYESGTLACSPSCVFDPSKCTDKEQCTDGVDNDKDGAVDCADTECSAACSASCTPAALTVITPDFLVVSGDTTGHEGELHSSCAAAQSGPEIVYQATADVTGVLDLALVSDADLGVSVRAACSPQASELGCADSGAGPQTTERLKIAVTAGDVVFIAVGGHSALDFGTYTLSVRNRAVGCGDGFTDPPEQCDDGATVAGDGCSALCTVESSEVEPNGTTALAGTYSAPWFGSIAPAGDVDVVAVVVASAPATLTASIGDLDGGCAAGAIDSYLEILDASGAKVLASDDDGGPGKCSAAQAVNLTPGTYYARVTASPKAALATFVYKLVAAVTSDVCGDGAVTGGEQCDDKNTTAGDGCSATCQIEITESEPNGTSQEANAYHAKWRAQIAPVGDVDVVAVSVAAGSSLVATVGDNGTGACAALAIVSHVDLLDVDGSSVLASGNGAPGNYCATAKATSLAGGTYFVRVKASNLAAPGSSDTFGYGLDVTVQ